MNTKKPSKLYKYAIYSWLHQLPTKEEYNSVMESLPKHLNVSIQTFKKWMYIKSDEVHEIPACSMYKICKFFNKDMDEFYNIQPNSISYYETHGIIKK